MLQAFVLARYADIESHDGDPDTMIIDALARSVGEVFRQQFGGYWKLYWDQPSDINHGLPVVIGYPGQQTPLQSHRLVTASIDRRTGVYLSGVLEMQRALRQPHA